MKNDSSDIKTVTDLPSFKQLEKNIFRLFNIKYSISKYLYGVFVTNNIIYNEKTHIVAKFKDYLIIDDISEFLKRYYTYRESLVRLPRYFDYYYTYSKIFPNYTALREAKYIYKNIYKKQKMIDLQQEEEESEEMKKKLKHQRKKNKPEINIIFDNDVYNSIIKQSQDLYMLLFGIEKNHNNSNNNEIQSSFCSIDIQNIVKSIEKYDYYSKNSFNFNNNIKSKKYIKKENNSSLTTKQSTFNSSNIHQKIKKLEKIYKKNNDNIIIGLKKLKPEQNIISNSLLLSNKFNKKNLLNKHLKSLTSRKIFISNENSKSKSKSKNKEINIINKIKVNQKYLIDEKKNHLTERASIHKRLNTQLEFLNSANSKQENGFNFKYKSSNTSSNNSKIKNIHINKKSNDFNYFLNKDSNLKVNKYKKIETISGITESNYKSYKIKLLNRPHTKCTRVYKNKIKLNLKEMRENIKISRLKDKHCYTERGSLTSMLRDKDKGKINQIKINHGIMKKIYDHKKSFPSIDFQSKINKNFLLSQKIINNSKLNKINLKNNFAPLSFRKENIKINKNEIIQVRNTRLMNSNIEKNEEKILYTQGESIIIPKREIIIGNNLKNDEYLSKFEGKSNFNILKGIKVRHFNTTKNSESKEKNSFKISKKIFSKNKNSFQFKKIENLKIRQIKRKQISPIKKTKDNNTEKNNRYFSKLILK